MMKAVMRQAMRCRRQYLVQLPMRPDHVARFGRGSDGNDLELDEIVPMEHPLLQKSCIVALYDMETATRLWARRFLTLVRWEP
jgi:hypothetical protein